MKALTLIGGLLLALQCLGQSPWHDEFEDGDLTAMPAWQGDVSDFTVNAQHRLQLMAPEAGTSRIYGRFTAGDSLDWDLFFELGFEPSSSNRLRIYPALTQPDPATGQGCVLTIGETGSSDAIRWSVWNQGEGASLGNDAEGSLAAANVPARVHIEYRQGAWTFATSYQPDLPLTPAWQGEYALPPADTFYFVVECTYTSTRRDLFEFDDIYAGPPRADLNPPEVTRVDQPDSRETIITWSEPLAPSAIDPQKYLLSPGDVHPQTISVDDQLPNRIHLTWSPPLIPGQRYALQVDEAEDLSGNTVKRITLSILYVELELPEYGDVVFNELMVDPTPSQGLPEDEYIELYNGSNKAIDLATLTIRRAGTGYPLPDGIFLPHTFLLLTSASDAEDFYALTEVTPMTSFPRLTNSGDLLELYAGDRLIHYINYNTSWYRDGNKDDGGWSLSMIDYDFRCGSSGNWIASNSPVGGTPGMSNDLDPGLARDRSPRLFSWQVPDPGRIELIFNQALATPLQQAHFQLSPEVVISQISWDFNAPNHLQILLNENLKENQLHQLTVSGLTSCSDAALSDTVFTIGLPRDPGGSDLLWSEILFNPRPGGADFAEIYNNTESILRLDSVFVIKTIDDIDAAISLAPIGNILPGQYLAWSPNRPSIEGQYRLLIPGNVYNLGLPTLPNEEGSIILFYRDRQGQPQLLDALHYYSNWHNAILSDVEGISLERIDFNAETANRDNWTSASAASGGATPGYRNSTLAEISQLANKFTPVLPVFSPDDDGFDDLSEIDYQLDAAGYVLNATIFDMLGNPVVRPFNQYTLSREGTLAWDGRNASGDLQPMGRYIWYLEIFNLNGSVERFKKTVVLAR